MIAASIGYAEKQEMAKDWCIPKKEASLNRLTPLSLRCCALVE
jgi:hypothetical protein